jgi:hypothetical protein
VAARQISRWVLGVLVTCGVSALALETARMELPEPFAANAERFPASGFGGDNRGSFSLGEYSGEFTRIESRWAVFDPLYARSRAKSSYTLSGPNLETGVAAECEMKEGTVTVGIVTFDPKKMTYQCSFTRAGAPMAASFVLGEVKPDSMRARLASRAERRGEAVVDGVRVTMRSVHRYAKSKWQSATPVGYLIEADARVVGAVELTDVNPTILLDPTAVDERHATLMAAMALAVLRDPENSALGE